MNRGINLSAALKNASENVFGVEAEVDIGTQGHIGANTCVIPSLFAGIAEVARCRMACGREGIIALELAECVSEDIRRAFCSAEPSVKVLPARRPIRPMMLLVSAI